MKELSELKNEFYEVMYKYEKSFSEKGVMADLTAWQTAKAELLSLLRRHPDWNEAEQAIIFDCNQALSIQPDTVDETAFTLLDIASEILSGEQLEDFRTALHAAVSGHSRTVPEENLEILRQRGGIRCTKDQKASRIIGKLCKKYGVDRHDRYNAVFAQLADALNPLIMQETGVLSVHPCDFLEMSSKSNTWMSCHRLNGGGYQAGCLSYMNDSVSMVFYAVDADVHGEYRKAIRRYAMCKNVLRLTAMLQQQTGHFPYQERIHRRGSMYGAQTSLFAPMIDRPPQKCACKLLMPLPEETRLYMGQHQISYAPEYMMDRSGNLYMYLESLKAAVEAEGVYACDEEGQPPVFSAVYEGTRFLQVYTYEEAVERLEQAEAAG